MHALFSVQRIRSGQKILTSEKSKLTTAIDVPRSILTVVGFRKFTPFVH